MSSADAAWAFLQCLEPLYPLLDADTKKAVRLVHPSARKMVEARTLSLKWETPHDLVCRGETVIHYQKGLPSTQDLNIIRKCPILQHVKIDGVTNTTSPEEEKEKVEAECLLLSMFPSTLKSLSVSLFDATFETKYEYDHTIPYMDTWRRLEDLSALGSMTSLTVLHVQEYSGFSNFSFLEVCPTLTSIRFARCDLESLQGVGALTGLKSLVLQRCEKLTDISTLSGSQLSEFTLWGCQQVENISALANCPALVVVSLAHSRKVADVTALASCRFLTRLDLSTCPDLVDISALGSCVRLQVIDLSYCCRIRNIAPLLACRNLQSIDLSYINAAVEGADELFQSNLLLRVHCIDGRFAEYDYNDEEYDEYYEDYYEFDSDAYGENYEFAYDADEDEGFYADEEALENAHEYQ
eukprot:gene5110-34912_t